MKLSRHIFLIGFMGCGKSTVSRRLAEECDVKCMDTDVRISDEQGMTISDIFEQKGEVFFRELETELLKKLGEEEPKVIACGGGMATFDRNIAIMKEYGLSVASCPVSNLKLASGIAPLARLKEAGVNITLATDGVASNNTLDLFEEMKLSVLLQKNLTGDASALSAWDALTFATVNGNIAMGRGERCGRLLPGYEADLAMLDFTAPHLNPCHNVISHVVYAAHGSDVELTMVRGRTVYENRRFPGIDMAEEIRRVNELVAKYLA